MNRMHEGALQVLREAGITPDLWARANFQADGQWRGSSCGCADPSCVGVHHQADEACPCLPEQIQEKFPWEYTDQDGDVLTIGRNGDGGVLVQAPPCGVAVPGSDLAKVFRAMCAKAGMPLQAVLAELTAGDGELAP